ncbi:MAG: NADH:flavin oxidoreductase/NADH oxidase family protein [Cellvibrionaceae bacterium]
MSVSDQSLSVFSPLALPNGTELPNRIAKAAMEENMADPGHLPGPSLFRLYEQWAEGGCGMLLTGNVMVDCRAMTGPGGVALEADTDLAPFQQWAKSAQRGGAKVWMQINHPGRQVYASMGGKALSPSDVPLDLGKHSHLFPTPRPMTDTEIGDVVERFVITAKRAVEAGFDGVQIHAAHGYLLSQFLSPLTNKRHDQWGGDIQGRAKLLMDIVRGVREALPVDAAVSVKLNSADFQRGGFEAEDAKAVVAELEKLGVDLVELSGGSYESPAMQGRTADGRSLAREAYFLTFAKDIAQSCSIPVMTTGGIKRLAIAQSVIDEGVDMVGMGTALAFAPQLPNTWRKQANAVAQIPEVTWSDKTLAALATMAIVRRQLQRMGKGKSPKPNSSPLWTMIGDRIRLIRLTKQYRARYQ